MNKRTARYSSSISRVKFSARTSFTNAARQQNFHARKKKFVDDLPQVHYPHTKQPSDGIHQPLSKILCDPHLRIERGDY
jgi:hypothetical protein